MKVNIELTTSIKEDVKILGAFGEFMANGLEKCLSGDAEKTIDEPDVKIEVNPTEDAAEQPQPEAPVEDKPKAKRVRRKKDEPVVEKPVVEEEPKEPEAVDEPSEKETAAAMEKEVPSQMEMPFDEEIEEVTEDVAAEEPVEVKVEPFIKKCTAEEWREIIQHKYCELGIYKQMKVGDKIGLVDGDNISLKPLASDFIHNLSATYGNRIPSKLDDETRYKFVEQFKRMAWNADEKRFEIDGTPF